MSSDVKLRVLGVAVNLSHFLTGKDDATVGNVSVLSRPREVHALLVGAIAAAAPTLVGLDPGLAAGGAGIYLLGRELRAWSDSMIGHLRDAATEPAYTAAGYGAVWLLQHANAALGGVVA